MLRRTLKVAAPRAVMGAMVFFTAACALGPTGAQQQQPQEQADSNLSGDNSELVQDRNECERLDEVQCVKNPECIAEFPLCTMICRDDGKGGCLPCPHTFVGCSPKPRPHPPATPPDSGPCGNLPEASCVAPFCEPIYAATCNACPAGSTCDTVCVRQYVGCGTKRPECTSNCDCQVNEYCSVPTVVAPACAPCPANGDCTPCAPPPAPSKGICVPAPGGGNSDGPISGGGSTDPDGPKR